MSAERNETAPTMLIVDITVEVCCQQLVGPDDFDLEEAHLLHALVRVLQALKHPEWLKVFQL